MALNDAQKPQEGQNSQNPEDGSKFTHVAISKPTQKKIALLAKIKGGTIYEMVGEWAELYWAQAREAGFVTDAMLKPPAHWVQPPAITKKTSRRPAPKVRAGAGRTA